MTPSVQSGADTGLPDSPRALSGPPFAILLAVAGVSVIYGTLESLLWADRLWGAHFYAFFPIGFLLVAAPVALAGCVLPSLRSVPEHETSGAPLSRRRRLWIASGAALVSGVIFWLCRARHLFWGDGLPLSIDIPKGQSFHPDEPLTMFVHQLLYRLGAGHWSGATAVAIGSVIAGMLFVGWGVYWFSRRAGDPVVWGGAVAVIIAQGFAAIFFGYVENYAYLAVALLLFFTLGVDFVEGRGGLLPALIAAVAAYAFHLLGGLTVVPAVVLVAHGLRTAGRRLQTVLAVVVALGVLLLVNAMASGLYPDRSPMSGVLVGAAKVLGNAQDMQIGSLFAVHHWANVWSELNLIGPLSLPWLALILAVLVFAGAARGVKVAFLTTGAVAMIGPCLLTGEGNLGAARNWDLFSAPALVAPLAGLVWLLDATDRRHARRLVIALLAVSLFHTVPWIALNTSLDRTMARVARLPLTGGRGETIVGTHYLNEGRLPDAETWFRRAIDRDSTNANSQSGLGLALARQGRLEEAVGPMSTAVGLRPNVVGYQDDLITLFVALERWDPASQVLELRLALEPQHSASWLMLASCRSRLEDEDGAVVVLEHASRTRPLDSDVRRELGDAYERCVVQHGRRREWVPARNVLGRFATSFPDDPRVGQLAAALAAEAPQR